MNIEQQNKELRYHLWQMIETQGKMLDRWADGDGMVQKELWQQLHTKGSGAREYLESIGSKINQYG